MRIAIFHYHLRPGGVTRVIELAWQALKMRGFDVLVVSGEPPPEGGHIPGSHIQVVPELCYDVTARQVDALVEAVHRAEICHWSKPADMRHFHNHALGKNFALPLAIAQWAQEGVKMLLQFHDFAENGRPANYRRLLEELGGPEGLSCSLYPVAPQIGYAVLTTSDRLRLEQAGLKSGAHLLPNPVSLPEESEAMDKSLLNADRVIVYPTRAIRRKNIGEAVLWAVWAGESERILLTGAPERGPDVPRHAEWREWAGQFDLPIVFDAQSAYRRSAADFLKTADICLTTSVAEGFGMAFLEPWIAGSSLAGRDLPDVTADFARAGIQLGGLYTRLEVEAGPISKAELRDEIERSIRATCDAYQMPFENHFLESALRSVWCDGRVDFGRLGEGHQKLLISHSIARGEKRSLPDRTEDLSNNREVILQEYSLHRYADRLVQAYSVTVAAKSAEPSFLNAREVLTANLSFDDYFACRAL